MNKQNPIRARAATEIRYFSDRLLAEGVPVPLNVELHEAAEGGRRRGRYHRRREIIQGANEEVGVARPMPHGARVILIDAIRQAHRWLDNLISNPNETVEAIASREGKTGALHRLGRASH